jgi:hypothetical protein
MFWEQDVKDPSLPSDHISISNKWAQWLDMTFQDPPPLQSFAWDICIFPIYFHPS